MSAKRDHTEPLVLYSLTVAEPSFKKSPVISLVKRPYATFAHDWNESNKQDIFKSQAERQLLESKLLALEKNDDVQLIGFGTFTVVDRAERKSINPATKQEMIVPASKSPKFKAGKALKELVNK